MEDKYFTPDIEDFYVGYEFETKVYGEDDTWVKCIYSKPTDELFCKDSDGNIWVNDSLRVPYLTKEQIEAEGWGFETVLFADDDENDVYSDGFAKRIDQDHWYEMVLRKDNKIHIVYKWYRNSVAQLWRDIYYGECKDINSFRTIIKLLKIN
jgi:hypothetical protein